MKRKKSTSLDILSTFDFPKVTTSYLANNKIVSNSAKRHLKLVILTQYSFQLYTTSNPTFELLLSELLQIGQCMQIVENLKGMQHWQISIDLFYFSIC